MDDQDESEVMRKIKQMLGGMAFGFVIGSFIGEPVTCTIFVIVCGFAGLMYDG